MTARVVLARRAPYLGSMQAHILLFLAALAAPSLAYAQARTPNRPAAPGPKSIGKFEDWQAVTHQEAGQAVCYAFARANASTPALPGRGDVVLTVTQRPGGRDAVAVSAGFAYPASSEVQMGVGDATFAFYTSNRSAFARDGKAAVAAFERGRQAVVKSPGPRAAQVSDTFSLRGFSAAYAATNKACPAR